MADIQKVSVFDERIVQPNPVMYAIDQGAVSVTNMNFASISATTSQHSYQIQAPSENIYLSRAVDWESTCYLQFTANYSPASTATTAATSASGVATLTFATTTTNAFTVGQTVNISGITPAGFNNSAAVILSVTPTTITYYNSTAGPQTVAGTIVPVTGGIPPVGQPLLGFGRDIALCSTPLHSLVSIMNATINDTTVSTNLSDVLWEVSRLSDSAESRKQAICPTYLDNFANYNDAYGTPTNAIAGIENAVNKSLVPNGAYYNVSFTDSAGAALTTVVPLSTGSGTTASIYIKFTSVERLMVSPFIWNETEEKSVGLSQIQNIQLTMNMQNPSFTNVSGRVLRYNTKNVLSLSNIAYNTTPTTGAFANSYLRCLFLTPSLALPLAPVNRVQYLEYPRYKFNINASGSAWTAGTTQRFSSQTITLPSIPDSLVIYAKPTSYAGGNFGDWYFPINNISCNFDAYSGLLSSLTNAQLYSLTAHNGIDVDFNTWNGYAYKNGLTAETALQTVQMVGAPLVLKPGRDITLQVGQASGLQGQFIFQFDFSAYNPTNATVTSFDLYVLTINSGFFESVKGSSRVQKNVISQSDIINADAKGAVTKPDIDRMVGEGKRLHKITSLLPSSIRRFIGRPTTMPIHSQPVHSMPAHRSGISKRLM
jgi:hypothetical protein